ncbi:uncharacterized protein [Dermacentor albipictus]|uniref:uncharacterized protein n=1 Tax=Dermacentor albipictus TaxID=60249 RepID=UPI0038FCE666
MEVFTTLVMAFSEHHRSTRNREVSDSAGAASVITTVTPLPTSTPTTTSSPPRKKPPLVCQMTSPKHVSSDPDKVNIIIGVPPEPGLCDYIVLDIPQTPDGKYKKSHM